MYTDQLIYYVKDERYGPYNEETKITLKFSNTL